MSKVENYSFESEVDQLLDIVINSLYSNNEIFLRELISNSSDALEKLRFKSLTNQKFAEKAKELQIKIDYDSKKNTICIQDNGIGMTKEELIDKIGTIAKSGTKEFLKSVKTKEKQDNNLIGQFGVGFYSYFIVAEKVEVHTRYATNSENKSYLWASNGKSGYSIEDKPKDAIGTTITLYLKKDCKEFAEYYTLKNIIKKYSDHAPFKILLKKEEPKKDEDPYELINRFEDAIWVKSKKDVKEEEYKEFYKYISNDFNDPLCWTHSKVEGSLNYTSLFYIPKKPNYNIFDRESSVYGLKLYVQKIFILDNVTQFLPPYLRFVKGVVDSNDLSLNISREILQSDPTINRISKALTKKVLAWIKTLSEKEPEKYSEFWEAFGFVLKEGFLEFHQDQESIKPLFRYLTIKNGDKKYISLDEYVDAMPKDQKKMHYLVTDKYSKALDNPFLANVPEGEDVLIMLHPIDELILNQMGDYKDFKIKSIAKVDSEVDDTENQKIKELHKESFEKIKTILEQKVTDIRVNDKIKNYASCLILDENQQSPQMEMLMASFTQTKASVSKPILEINTQSELFKLLSKQEIESEKFEKLVHQIYYQAAMNTGYPIEDSKELVDNINYLINAKNSE